MNDQDPQTAIDYNLYPSSARPSGLQVPTDLEIKALKEQVASLVASQQICVGAAGIGDFSELCGWIDEKKKQVDSLRGALHDIFEIASRQKSNRDCATDEGLIATALAAVRVIRNVCDERKEWKSPEEVAAIVEDRDAAVKEAARRDQKWMDGINEIMGHKLDYGDPSSPNAASTGLEKYAKLQTQFTAHTQALKMADGVLRDCERRGSNLDLVAIRYCIDTINNLLK